ncbi:MAG: AMP-binding protein [Thermodesulfobacteriota bacterium]
MNRPWLAHYETHVPHSLSYPEVPVHHFLMDTVEKHPEDTAVTFNDMHYTYKVLNERVNRFAHALLALGVEKGDRIAFLLVNSPTYVFAFFAAMKLGAVGVNISVGIQGEELARCLKGSGAKVVVTLDLFAQNVYQVIRATDVKSVILHSVFGLEKRLAVKEGLPQPLVFQELIASAGSAAEPDEHVSAGDTAVLQYTSGSTGAPKAATLTHSNLVATLTQSEAWMGVRGAGNDAVLCIIPFFHVFGMSACLLLSVMKGYRMVLLPRMDLMDILGLMNTLEAYRPISFPAVPSLWTAILSLPPEVARKHLAPIRVPVSGGAPLPSWAHERFEELTGRKIVEAYGLSEASSATHFTPYPRGGPMGSIGMPLPDTDARIMDLETGQRECGVGEIGELVVKGPQVMQGYWGDRDLTSRRLKDGWLYTGDLARMDGDGVFYLVDRKDDLIISSGFNVYPGQVEEVLMRHPKVKDAAVLGVSDPIRGQAVLAVIVTREGMAENREEILAYCRDNMPDHRVPKAVLFRKEIPRDPAGKLLRRVLKSEIPAA